jgi:OFA family oxalate/formate antiporter-like MFS transporter
MRDTKGHRWLIVLGTIIVQMGLGTIYTWSLFNQPLVEHYGWELSSVAATFSILSFSLAFATLFSSKIQEKIGLRRLIMFAGITLGLGLIISSQVTSLWVLYLFAGVLVGAADGTAYMTTLSNAIKWFPKKKGLISGISVGAYGTGSLVFKYINSSMIETLGVSKAFMFWGIIVMVMIVGGSFLVKEAKVQNQVQADSNTVQKDYTVKEMLKTKEAYLLFIIFFTACMSGLFLIGIVKDIGVSMAGLNAATAANAVALVAIFNTLGRIVLGALSDRVGHLNVVSGTLFVTAAAVIILSYMHLSYGSFFACVAAIAFCFGGNITVFPAIVANYFGLKNSGQNYGVIYQGFGFGALLATMISSFLGGFVPTFKLIAAMCMISFILIMLLKLPAMKKTEKKKWAFQKLQHE